MAQIQTPDSAKCWQRRGTTGTSFITAGNAHQAATLEGRLAASDKTNMFLPQNRTFVRQGNHPVELKTYAHPKSLG